MKYNLEISKVVSRNIREKRSALGYSQEKLAEIAHITPLTVWKIENQDAFYISRNKDYVLALVSDGLGSKKYSDLGSKMAGLAVNNSIRKIIKEKGSLEQEKFGALLLSNIAEEWKQLVKPKAPEDCSATCLFVIITAGNIYAFRLGDGMLFFKPAGGEDAGARGAGISANTAADQGLLLQDDKSGEFSNATVSLSNENMLFSWETKKLERIT